MKSAISIDLDGTRFALDERAFVALRAYLDRAAARLGTHPDRDEVIAGLERSIAAKLARHPAARADIVDEQEMLAALTQVGRVDGPSLDESDAAGAAGVGSPRPRRPLYRLRDGQQIAGVCAGLAAFAEIDVGLVRLIFILGAVFTGGMLLLAYLVLMFIMPIAHTDLEMAEARGGRRTP